MKLYSTIHCLTCGEDLRVGNKAPSAFILGSCGNMNCEAYMVSLVIERATMTIIAITPGIYVVDGKRVYPVLVDKEGVQVWPKEDSSVKPVEIVCGLCHRWVYLGGEVTRGCTSCEKLYRRLQRENPHLPIRKEEIERPVPAGKSDVNTV